MDSGVVLEAEQETNTESLGCSVWIESKKLWRVAGPAMIVKLCNYGAQVVTQSFVGRGGDTQLAAYVFACSILVRLSFGFMMGMGSATETLCGQAFGAKKYHAMGIYLQRSWLIVGGVVTAIVPFFIFAAPIARLIGQDKDLSAAVGPISLWFIPVIYYFVFYITTQMYLQTQRKNRIIAFLALPAFLLHLLLSWLAVDKMHWGTAGAMASLVITSWLQIIGGFVYVFCGWCPETWNGLSWETFTDLLPMIKLSFSSGIMVCLQISYNAALVLMAGYMRNAKVAIAAFSICLHMTTWEQMMSFGFLVATSARVANELGRGNAKGTKFAIKVALLNSSIVGTVFFVLFLAFGNKIGYAFTSSEEIRHSVSSLSVLLAISIVPNTIQPVLSGTAIGAGYQGIVAYANIACYYIIGIPLGIGLGYFTHLQIKGIWIGMLLGAAAQVLIVAVITIRTDWDLQVEKAKARLNKWAVQLKDNANESNK